MKIGRLDLIEQLFGEVQIPDAVYIELVSNSKFREEAQKLKESPFIRMGLHLMGTVGMLWAAHEGKLLSYEEIQKCIEELREI